jgi:hypothetical protein
LTAFIILSVVIGIFLFATLKSPIGYVLSFIAPFVVFASWIIFLDIFSTNPTGGASFWPVAIVFGGLTSAVTGLVTFCILTAVKSFLVKEQTTD